MFKKTVSILLLIVAYCLSAFQNGESRTLKIIETTDLHGMLFPQNFITGTATKSSLAHVAALVKAERTDKSQSVILLDNGDFLQGQPSVYYYNFEVPHKPHISALMMNELKYDAASVGNHDLETGHAVYDRLKKECKFPLLSANLIDKKSGLPYFTPYKIINKDGLKIAVIGLTSPVVLTTLPEVLYSGIEVEDMVKSAASWMKTVEEKEHPDLVIGLFHAGVDEKGNLKNRDVELYENASEFVAQKVEGFDLILTGHDHKAEIRKTRNISGNEVVVMGGLNDAKTLATAQIKMIYDAKSSSWQKEIRPQLVDMQNYAPDSSFMAKFNSGYTEIQNYVQQPLGNITETITSREAVLGASAFTDLINRIQLELTGADISFAAPLSFQAEIKKGPVLVKDLFSLYQYENFLYTMKLSGKEIKAALEYSCNGWFNTVKSENDHLMNFVTDSAGNLVYSQRSGSYELKTRYYNYDCASGIKYSVDITQPAGNKINIISLSNGQPFEPDKFYTVAINSYRGSGGGGHLTKGAGLSKTDLASRLLKSTDQDLRYYIMKWIEKNKTIEPVRDNNWQIIPADLYEKVRAKDEKLLYESQK